MFERWTDVLAALGTAATVGYVLFEIARRQKKLRELFDVLGADDRKLTDELEELVRTGKLRAMTNPATA